MSDAQVYDVIILIKYTLNVYLIFMSLYWFLMFAADYKNYKSFYLYDSTNIDKYTIFVKLPNLIHFQFPAILK